MGGMRPDRRDVYLCLCLTDCVAVCLYFCVNCVRVEFYLHANRPVILHKAHALIQAIQRRTLCKSHINNWSSSLNILSKIHPSKKKKNPKGFSLHSFSATSCHPFPSVDRQQTSCTQGCCSSGIRTWNQWIMLSGDTEHWASSINFCREHQTT